MLPPLDLVFGLSPVDSEHVKLFDLANRLRYSVQHPADLMLSVLAELQDYVVQHFAHEEQLIQGWSGYAQHVAQHRQFAQELKQRSLRLQSHGATESEVNSLADYLNSWLIGHIDQEDRQYVAWVKNKRNDQGDSDG